MPTITHLPFPFNLNCHTYLTFGFKHNSHPGDNLHQHLQAVIVHLDLGSLRRIYPSQHQNVSPPTA